MEEYLIKALQIAVLITGFFGAYKYKFMTLKVSRLKSSKEISRKFLNASILERVFLLLYVSLVLNDKLLITISCFALYTMCEAFYVVYKHYPYRNRHLKNFKRPSIWVYFKHSITPGRKKRKL
jgi:hypothetical protein